MKYLQYLLMTLVVMGTFIGCSSEDETSNNSTEMTSCNDHTQFFNDVTAVLNQNEDDEPLEVTDSVDDSTNFDSLL